MKKELIIILLLLCLIGCSSSTVTTKETEINVPIPDIKEQIAGEIKADKEIKIDFEEYLKNLPTDIHITGETTVQDKAGRQTDIKYDMHLTEKDTSGNIKPTLSLEQKSEPIKANKKETLTIKQTKAWYEPLLQFFKDLRVIIILGIMLFIAASVFIYRMKK